MAGRVRGHAGWDGGTGVYWKPVFQVLEDRFECWLLNAQHLRNVPGRKTDVKDSEWICDPYLVALVTLDGDAAARLAAGIGIPPTRRRCRTTTESAPRSRQPSTLSMRISRGSSRSSASRSSIALSPTRGQAHADNGGQAAGSLRLPWTASTHNPIPWCRTGATRSVPIRLHRRIQMIGKAGR